MKMFKSDDDKEPDDRPLIGRNWLEGSPNLDNNYYYPTSYTEAEVKELCKQTFYAFKDDAFSPEEFDEWWNKYKKK